MSAAGDLTTSPSVQSPVATRGRLGTAFIWVARIEAFTWAGLLIGMAFKYVIADNETGVHIFGPIHGAAFVTYISLTLAVAITRRWSFRLTLVGLAASIPPLMTWPFERYVERNGKLDRRA